MDIDADGSCSWRLTAPNGRVIAMAARSYRDRGECRAAFEQLCASGEELQGEVLHASEGGGWVWRIRDHEGAAVAASARAYERHSTCRTAYERFRTLLTELASVAVGLWGDAE